MQSYDVRIELVALCGLVEKLYEYSGRLIESYSKRLQDATVSGSVVGRIYESLSLINSRIGEVKSLICEGEAGRAEILRAYHTVETLYYQLLSSNLRTPTTVKAWVYEILARLKRLV